MLSAGSYVGVVRVGDVQLRVHPKLRIRRLLWLVGYAHDPGGWREEDIVDLADIEDLVPAIAVSLAAAARRATAAGILQGYRVTEQALPVLRGRLREADQLHRRLALILPVEVRYDDYTADIAENQILLTAARRLLGLPDVPAPARAGLRHLTSLLAEVTPLPRNLPPPPTRTDPLTRRYQPALRLARLVLADRGLDLPPGPTTASGFLFNLNTVFEDWLAAVLGQTLARTAAGRGQLRRRYSSHLDDGKNISIRPDLVWETGGIPAAVLDVKYKALHHGGDHRNADLYQMLAYCAAFGLPDGHLVYAAGETTPSRHVMRGTRTRIHIWAVDLAQPIPDLLRQIDQLANEIVAT